MSKGRIILAGLMLSFLPLLCGCETLGLGTVGDGGGLKSLNILSTQEEIKLGQECSAEVEKTEPLLNNPAVQAYVAGIADRLARVATRTDVTYSVKVIDKPDTVNAFALPGGFMYVYTGLMKICENEAELAAVMAHEFAHVAAHHHGESVTRQYGYSVVASVLLGSNPNAAAQIVAGLVGQAGMSKFSRNDEYEADTLGMEFLFRAGYKPEGMVSFMEKLCAQDKGGNPLPIFSSHPPTPDRLSSLQQLLLKYPADVREKSPLYAERYQKEVLAVVK